MAVKLVTEVMDQAPPLTHREHKVLIILAENALQETREIWDSVESPKILRRAQLNRREMYVVIAALVRKGCLDKPVWGGHNHRAKYRIAQLGRRSQCAQKPHTENHDQCVDLQHTENPVSVCAKPTPRLSTGTGRDTAGLEGANGTPLSSPGVAERRAAEGGTTPSSDGVQTPTPSQTRKRVHDGPERDGSDVQHFSIGVNAGAQPQTVTREAAP